MYHKKRTLCNLMRCSWKCLNVIVFFAQARPTGLTRCRLWTWRESLCLSWELGHQGAMGWRLYNCWSMNMVCCGKSMSGIITLSRDNIVIIPVPPPATTQDNLDDKLRKFEIRDMMGLTDDRDISETVSETWSTDVLGSDFDPNMDEDRLQEIAGKS